MTRPLLIDLYCCEGGAGKGYADAGFEVIGVDVKPQPRYPFEFIRQDALEFLNELLDDGLPWPFDRLHAFHASPPCQADSKTQRIQGREHPRLIEKTREMLERLGLPYVIENVPGAPLRDPAELCGTMFGLRLYRHRLFETNWPLTAPLHGEHYLPQVKMGRSPGPHHILQPVGNFAGVAEAREAMGMPWASRDGLREAIPPAYTEYIGRQLMTVVRMREEAAA
jgi:DNA (cytosine-5)-methyltransferase 1